MDPLSIAGACVGLLSSIATLSKSLSSFVMIARQARKDVDGCSRELSSLGLCISTLRDEKFEFPSALQDQLLGVLSNCGSAMEGMSKIIDKHKTGHIGRQIQWSISDRDEVCRLRERLEAHKSALEITLEVANLTVVTTIQEDTSEIKIELAALRLQVMQLRDTQIEPSPILQRYLNETIAYTESVIDPLESSFKDERSVVALDEELSETESQSTEDFSHTDPQLGVQDQPQVEQDAAMESLRKGTADTSQSSLSNGPSVRWTTWADVPFANDSADRRSVLSTEERRELDRRLYNRLRNNIQGHPVAISDLINQGARYEAGRIDFGHTYGFHFTAQDLRRLLDYGHTISHEPTALLRYLSTQDRVDPELVKFLLSKADIHRAITEKMIKRYYKPFLFKWYSGVGETVLHIAAARPDCGWLGLKLCECGAKVNQKDSRGKTPMDLVIDGTPYIEWRGRHLGQSIKNIRTLRNHGAVSTYNMSQIRAKAAKTVIQHLKYLGSLEIKDFATRHGLPISTTSCFHLTRKCPRSDCENLVRKISRANERLITAYEDEVLEAGFGYTQ